MGWRFHKSFKIAPGIRLNVEKKSSSISFGPRGAKITVGTRGTHVTAGIPGTGLYDTEKLGSSGNPGHPMTVCPYCGHRMRKHWDNCPQCGHPLTTGQDGETDMHSSFLGCVSMIVAAVVLMILFL